VGCGLYCKLLGDKYLEQVHKDIYNIERVQRSFIKRLPSLKSLSYTERLLRLNLESLESRRVKADLVILFKVIHGFVDIDYSAMFDIQYDCTTIAVTTFVFVSVILMLMLVNFISVIV